MVISVNSPGLDSTKISPPWRRMMSLQIDRPRPVPLSVGLVVKKGLNIFSMTSGGIPVPLSRMRTSMRSSPRRVVSSRVGI